MKNLFLVCMLTLFSAQYLFAGEDKACVAKAGTLSEMEERITTYYKNSFKVLFDKYLEENHIDYKYEASDIKVFLTFTPSKKSWDVEPYIVVDDKVRGSLVKVKIKLVVYGPEEPQSYLRVSYYEKIEKKKTKFGSIIERKCVIRAGQTTGIAPLTLINEETKQVIAGYGYLDEAYKSGFSNSHALYEKVFNLEVE